MTVLAAAAAGYAVDVITFLLSDAARHVTAQALTVDGGLTSVWPG